MASLLQERGDPCRIVVDITHFDSWFQNNGEPDVDLIAFNKASVTEKAGALNKVVSSWESSIGSNILDLEGFDDLYHCINAVGFDNTIKLMVYGVLEAGFDVYHGDSFIEIYRP